MLSQRQAHLPRRIRAIMTLTLAGALGACTSDSPMALTPSVSLARFIAGGDTAAAAAKLRAELSAKVDRRTFVTTVSESAPEITSRQRVTVATPWGVAVNTAGTVVVTNLYQDRVTFINAATGAVLGTTAVGYIPSSVAFNRTGTTAFVGNQYGNSLSVINAATRAVVATIPLFDEPYSLVMSPNGVHMIVGTSTGWIRLVDVTTQSVVGAFYVGGYLNGLAVDSAGKRLFASTMYAGTLHEVDLTTRSLVRTFALGGTPQGLSLNPAGNRLIIANEAGFLSDLNVTTGTWVNYAAGGGQFGLTTRANFSHATMTIPFWSALQAYLPLSSAMKPSFMNGGEPRRAAVHQASKTTIVTNKAGWVDLIR
ncbi:MAG: YncE family protein [Gemmatimonadaceae bacterium]